MSNGVLLSPNGRSRLAAIRESSVAFALQLVDNDSYVSNRKPLVPNRLIQLPVGSVERSGWLRETLDRQRHGLFGHLGEISAWLQKQGNVWIEGTLASQRENGDFGPDQRLDDGNRDYRANMVMLFCLQSYYEHTQDN